MSHSLEPWREGTDREIIDANGEFVADWLDDVQITPDNRARIIACVNACRGIPTKALIGKQFAKFDDRFEWTYILGTPRE